MDRKSSAPELPHEVAAQYGLHHEAHNAAAAAAMPPRPDKPDGLERPLDDNTETDQQVDKIVAAESDQLLDLETGSTPPTVSSQPASPKGFWSKVRRFFARWWANKWARSITIIVVLAGLAAATAIPGSRYALLNTVGVRSSATVTVLDQTTQLPLKNVRVSLGGQTLLTDRKGTAAFTQLRLGPTTLSVKRLAFAPYQTHLTIGWGSNPLGSVELQATGIQYVITVNDYVSGKPIAGVEADTADATALSDTLGKITLTVEETSNPKLAVTLSASNYNAKTLTLDATNTSTFTVTLVPSGKDVFISKQSGKYDVYSADIDGQNRKLLLAGTGLETSNMSLVVKPDGTQAALVSSRDDKRDSDGYLLQALTIIDLTRGASATIDHAEQIQLIDWVGDRLVYNITVAGASAANPQRNRLVAYKLDANSKAQLASANQFNAILSVRGSIYYTVSGTDPNAALGLFRIRPDGSGRKQLSDGELWTGLRSTYNTLSLQAPDGWYSYDTSTEKFVKIAAPPVITSYAFVDAPTADKSLWTDVRDGKGTLLSFDIAKGTSAILQAQDGITDPFRWLDANHILYRVSSKQETADYVLSTDGGSPKKVTDVTGAYSYARSF